MDGKNDNSSASMIASIGNLINVLKNKEISPEQNQQTKNANLSINSLEDEKNEKE